MSKLVKTLVFASLVLAPNANAVEFSLVPMQLGGYEIQVQLTDTIEKRMKGLMGQKPLLHGLILLYEEPREIRLWMKDTPSALDVAFIDENWVVNGLTSMEPFSLETHSSPSPAIAALEMPKGWLAAHQITVGTKITYCPVAKELCAQQRPQLKVIAGI